MGIGEQLGKPKAFLIDCLVAEMSVAEMLQFSELFQRNKGPGFHNLKFL